ncbi:MAG TPA: hypothetical protein VFC19_52490 [Candidatus Limnocylindrales bacterium]|nr:hypothetical protein [Candidatus Limnocylindrales bacterium]
MKAQVVYESMFGNTILVAEAIAGGIARLVTHGASAEQTPQTVAARQD